MSFVKRKVQAQRKFAQGAPLPNSIERRNDTVGTPKTDNDKKALLPNVVVTHMSANSLLDEVSMHSIYPRPIVRTEPIVLIEKLQDKETIVPQKPKPKVKPIITNHMRPKLGKIIKPLRTSTRSSISKNVIVMELRSRSLSKHKKKVLKSQSFNKSSRRRANPTCSKVLLKRSKRNKSSEFSTDDDTPLNKITKTQQAEPNCPKVSGTSQKSPVPPSEITENTPCNVTNDNINEDKAVLNSYYGRNKIVQWLQTQQQFDTAPVTASENILPDNTCPEPPLSPTPQPCPKPATFKIPKPVAAKIPKPVISKLPNPVTKKSVKRNIEKITASDIAADDLCSSRKFRTVRSIQSATDNDFHDFCKECNRCKNILTMKRLKLYNGVHSETAHPSTASDSDVYEFNDSESADMPVLGFRHDKEQEKEKENTHYIYLDLLPKNSTHVIQLVAVNLPEQGKMAMRAKLVPKIGLNHADFHEQDILPLLDQEHFYKELLHCLNVKQATEPQNDEVEPVENKEETKPPTTQSHQNILDLQPMVLVEALPGPSKASVIKNPNPNPEKIVDAPTFYPTEAEFENPYSYIQKISPEASAFGICRIVPPKSFKPSCYLDENTRFKVTNQYLGKMYQRWGPASREMAAIKTYLATANVPFSNSPLVENIEVDLQKLYHIVQRMGGLNKVLEKGKWHKVAEEMNYPKGKLVEKKLDQVYVKYLLPYDTLTHSERRNVISKVEKAWAKRYSKMLYRAQNPLHKQRQMLGASSSDDEDDDDDDETSANIDDECVVAGREMNLPTFEKVARNMLQMQFGSLGRDPTPKEVEEKYWNLVLVGQEHICVNTAAIDTGKPGYGFTKNKADPYHKHPWNLKALSSGSGSLLRSLGSVMSVTVPTLHLGMLYSTSCWHRDPHGLPWLEYIHSGSDKIWYGIRAGDHEKFRKAVEILCPAYCQNKSIWLPSDIAMIPPNLLKEQKIALSKVVQKPGEFVLISPKAYSCSICTGYTVSESVYYAPQTWLQTVQSDFQEVRESFEPTMFSLEQLLISIAADQRVAPTVLPLVYKILTDLITEEMDNRRALLKNIQMVKENKHLLKKKEATREIDECDICRTTLFLSKVNGIIDKSSTHCLRDALVILEKKVTAPNAVLITYFSEKYLDDIISKLKSRLKL